MGAELIEVVVIEDHPLYREGLVQLVHASRELNLVAAAPVVEEIPPSALGAAQVAIMDLHLPGIDGPDAIRYVLERGPAILILSATDDPGQAVEAMAAGASGYLTKTAEGPEVIAAATMVASGESYVSPILAGHLLTYARSAQESPLPLTSRELEILELVAEGERDMDIAEQLFISVRTVHSHLARIRDKTGQRRRSELTRFAVEHRLVRRNDR
jgi:DNA-binding NarL/FixJ family response regulator